MSYLSTAVSEVPICFRGAKGRSAGYDEPASPLSNQYGLSQHDSGPQAEDTTLIDDRSPSEVRAAIEPTEFVRLWTAESRRLLSYIASLGSNWTDAEEILQDVSVTAWEKREEFEPGTNFGAWLRQIAKFKTLGRMRKRNQKVVPSDNLAELIADEHAARSDEFDERHTALAQCLERLPAKELKLLKLRYGDSRQASAIATALGRSVGAIYTALHRVHRALHDCVSMRLEAAE